ncbi:MAG: DNA cytosine methyltransferase [Opitutaceae bacterium]
MSPEKYSLADVASILSVSKRVVETRAKNGTLKPDLDGGFYSEEQLLQFEEFRAMRESRWDEEISTTPTRAYQSVELFAGAGGLALGLEKAGFSPALLNEIDSDACATLSKNRPHWPVVPGDVSKIDFTALNGNIDFVSGGFPCQAFSYAGRSRGFEDTRGTLFFEFARAIREIQPRVFLGENVRGLLNHDNGRTVETIKSVLTDLGYTIIEPEVLKAIFYQVPQKRERIFFLGIRNDYLKAMDSFQWPAPYTRIMTLKDALKAGELFPQDVPLSKGQNYPKRKEEILSHVPQGGYWRDLPDDLQREYMKKSYFLGGGKTGMARRLSWDEPSLTLTCAPAQKQTERCHPEATRPLTVREYARVQTFPDEWDFCGTVTSQYKQIGNAVPVNLAYAVGRSIVRLLNRIEKIDPKVEADTISYLQNEGQTLFAMEDKAKIATSSS